MTLSLRLIAGCSQQIQPPTDEMQMTDKPGLSGSELLAIEDDVDFVGTVIDDIWAMPWPDDQGSEEYVAFFKSLPPQKRLIWATWRLQGEVDNGGFGQYFTNIEDDCYIDEALDGLTTLGASELRDMLEQVIKYRYEHADEIAKAKDWSEYVEIMGVVPLDQALDKITFRFIDKNPELYALRRRYILQHLDVFAPRP
jgi:uncharacterized protein DUF4375